MNFDRALQAEINEHCDQLEMESWDIYDRSPNNRKTKKIMDILKSILKSCQHILLHTDAKWIEEEVYEIIDDANEVLMSGFTEIESEVLLKLLRENQDTLSQQLRANLTAKINNLTNYGEQTNVNE